MNLFGKLKTEKQKAAADVESEYWTALTTINVGDPSPADSRRLDVLLQATGRSIEQAEKDYQLVQQALERRRFMRDNADHGDLCEKTGKAYLAVCAERQKVFAELNEKVMQAYHAENAALSNRDMFYFHRNGLNELEKGNPDAYRAAMAAKL